MAWIFGDGFDIYTQFTDAYAGASYWDSGATSYYELSNFGRFTGSRGLCSVSASSNTIAALVKASGSNDTTHHINIAVWFSTSPSGTTSKAWITLYDGTTAQCSIVFRSDGAILLVSGATGGTTLATYTGGVTVGATWYSFEIEVVINNTTGSFKVRKNGNATDDHSTTGLNTRGGTANNYANKIGLGYASNALLTQVFDDILWRSDSTVTWAGDVRCYTRLPSTDGTVQFTRSGSVAPVTPYVQAATANIASGTARYAPFVTTCSGTVGTATVSLNLGYTGNMKCTVFNDTGSGAPGTVLGSATAIVNPATGNNTFTFGSPPSVVQGTKYWIGFDGDAASTNGWNLTASGVSFAYSNSGATSSTAYASFPTASPSVSANTQCPIFTVNITPTTLYNASLVSEVVQDGSTSYVSDSTSGDQDLYNIQAISGTPTSTIAVTTRAVAQKSDAGTRSLGVQVKSGSTTSNGTSTALSTSFSHIWRTDTVDPATSAAWTATAVNNLQCGVKVTA